MSLRIEIPQERLLRVTDRKTGHRNGVPHVSILVEFHLPDEMRGFLDDNPRFKFHSTEQFNLGGRAQTNRYWVTAPSIEDAVLFRFKFDIH